MATYVALLYSIIIDANRRVVMSELRAIAESAGSTNVRTLASTGNLVFDFRARSINAVEKSLEAEFSAFYGKHVDVIVKTAAEWKAIVAGNPFRAEAEAEPDRVHVRVMRDTPRADLIGFLEPYLGVGERVQVVDGQVWVYFSGPSSLSKLPAQLTPRRMGGTGTARNWNTVRRLGEFLA